MEKNELFSHMFEEHDLSLLDSELEQIKSICRIEDERTMEYFDSVNGKKNGWISVEDRLPEKFDDVLVTDGKAYLVAYVGQYGWALDNDSLDAENYDGGCTVGPAIKATHWQPLPQAPKQGVMDE